MKTMDGRYGLWETRTSDITRSVLHFKIIGYVGGVSASQTDEKIN